MIFEMTLDYSVVLPMALTVAVSHGARRLLLAQNIYTMKLARRGHYMPEALQANAYLVHHVGDMTMATAATLPADARVDRLSVLERTGRAEYLVLWAQDGVTGVVPREAIRVQVEGSREQALPAGLIRHDFVTASTETTIFDLIVSFQRAKAELAVILSPEGEARGADRVRGVVTKAHLAEALAEGMEIFAGLMIMYAHILVPIDGSACSDAAVAHALAIAKAMGSTVVFLFVMDTLSARQEGVVNVQEARVALAARGRPILDAAKEAAVAAGVRAEGELVEGVPADVIAQRGADFDLVVMGSHGKGLWKRLTVGSVTQAVLHQLSRPVLVVRKAAESAPTG